MSQNARKVQIFIMTEKQTKMFHICADEPWKRTTPRSEEMLTPRREKSPPTPEHQAHTEVHCTHCHFGFGVNSRIR